MDGTVRFWDPDTGNTQLIVSGHKSGVISVASSLTGMYFATASADKGARIWLYGREI